MRVPSLRASMVIIPMSRGSAWFLRPPSSNKRLWQATLDLVSLKQFRSPSPSNSSRSRGLRVDIQTDIIHLANARYVGERLADLFLVMSDHNQAVGAQ